MANNNSIIHGLRYAGPESTRPGVVVCWSSNVSNGIGVVTSTDRVFCDTLK